MPKPKRENQSRPRANQPPPPESLQPTLPPEHEDQGPNPNPQPPLDEEIRLPPLDEAPPQTGRSHAVPPPQEELPPQSTAQPAPSLGRPRSARVEFRPSPQPAPAPRTFGKIVWTMIVLVAIAGFLYGYFTWPKCKFWGKQAASATATTTAHATTTNANKDIVEAIQGLGKSMMENGIPLRKEQVEQLIDIAMGQGDIQKEIAELPAKLATAVMAAQTSASLAAKSETPAKDKKTGLVTASQKKGATTASAGTTITTIITLDGLATEVKQVRAEVKRVKAGLDARDKVELIADGKTEDEAEKALHDGNLKEELAAKRNNLDKTRTAVQPAQLNERLKPIESQLTDHEKRLIAHEKWEKELDGALRQRREETKAKQEYYGKAIKRLKTVGRFGSPKKALKDLYPPNVPAPPAPPTVDDEVIEAPSE